MFPLKKLPACLEVDSWPARLLWGRGGSEAVKGGLDPLEEEEGSLFVFEVAKKFFGPCCRF